MKWYSMGFPFPKLFIVSHGQYKYVVKILILKNLCFYATLKNAKIAPEILSSASSWNCQLSFFLIKLARLIFVYSFLTIFSIVVFCETPKQIIIQVDFLSFWILVDLVFIIKLTKWNFAYRLYQYVIDVFQHKS